MANAPLDLHGCARARHLLSFEFYPPKTAAGEGQLWDAVRELSALTPDFVSVTYGAGGSTRTTSLGTVRRLVADTTLTPVAHITCVGASRAELEALVGEFLDEGIVNFLALRGDWPRPGAGATDWKPAPGQVHYAQQLVSLIRQVAAERGIDQAGLAIGVAAFPGGHAQSTSLTQDIAVLAEKERLGASFAITQLFFYPSEYAALVERARGAGITMPIIAGIMPMTSPARLRRMASLSGQGIPVDLLAGLEQRDGAARYDYGMAASEELARAVLAMGAPGLHIYTLNQAGPAVDLAARLGWLEPAGRKGQGR